MEKKSSLGPILVFGICILVILFFGLVMVKNGFTLGRSMVVLLAIVLMSREVMFFKKRNQGGSKG